MGALDEGHFSVELENEVKYGSIELGFESEPETVAIVDVVEVLLEGLGEDINREGIKKTSLRVAKALRDGTRGLQIKSEVFSDIRDYFCTRLQTKGEGHCPKCFIP